MHHLPRNRHGETRARYAALWLLLAMGAAHAENLADAPHHVTAVRFWSLGGVTRIAIETDGDFQVKSDRLDSPDRLFFDLSGTKPTLGNKSMTVIPVSDHFVKQIRVAEPQHNVTRVVLDLETSVEPTVSRLDNPTRLIIELRSPGSAPETTKAPVKTPPTLVDPRVDQRVEPKLEPRAEPKLEPKLEPTQAPKPAERRPFTPPQAQPVVIPVVQAREAWLDPPPQLQTQALFSGALGPSMRSISNALVAKAPSPSINSELSRTKPPAIETALPAKRNSSGDRSMIRALGLKVGRIVLDPGHGGHDTGSVGPEGLREKDLVLDVAQRLGRLIQDRMGSEVIFTRSDDTFIPLERRTEIANEAKADLFLSIHANSSPLRSAAGVETYYLNFTTSRSALDLASRENSGSQMTVYELQGLLQKIALKDKAEESREFASRVQTALYTLSAKTTDARSRDRGIKKAPFVVLIGASMPSVLAEIGFVSNAHDESAMRREEYREKTAEALFKGISNYANTLSHFQVAQRH